MQLHTTIDRSQTSVKLRTRSPLAGISRGGLDEINPEDIIYGEYACDAPSRKDEHIDLLYLDGDIIRTFSGKISSTHPVIEELKILLRDDKKFYLILIKEVTKGFAFKRTDITDIKTTSLIQGNDRHEPSCTWTMRFENGIERSVEVNYQSYFSYGNTVRPRTVTNQYILERVFL
jgi:hypothetical protein